MYLNSYIISKWLKGITKKRLVSDPLRANLVGVMQYEKDIKLENCFVYVCKDDVVENAFFSDPCVLIIAGEPSQEWMDSNCCDILCCSEHTPISLLIEKVTYIFGLYASWEQQLLNAIIEKKTLSDLCQISIPIFKNPMMIHGVDFELLGYGEDSEHRYTYQFKENGTDFLNQDVVNMLITDVHYPATFAYKTPQFYYDKWDVIDLYENIFLNDTYVGRVIIDSIYEPLSECDFVPIMKFVQYIERHLELYPTSVFTYLSSFKKELASFINTNAGSDRIDVLNHTLTRIGWVKDAQYICAYIEPNSRAFTSNSIEFQCELLENTFHNCIALVVENHIFCIFNCTILNYSTDSLQEKLIYFIRDQLMHAGISTVFRNFMKLPSFYLQAKATFEFGEMKQDTQWIHTFHDIQLEYVLTNGIYSLPEDALLPIGIQELIAYDKKHNGQLFDTLKVYMEENKNIQKSIERLFIHRSTFNYI